MPLPFSVSMTGTAFDGIAKLAKDAHKAIMASVNKAAHTVQARAKVNVHAKLNTTGLSKGTLARSVTVLSHPSRLEAEIGPSVIYGRIHELGGVIKPKKGLFLWFRLPGAQAISIGKGGKVKGGAVTAGHLIRVKEVTIPARPYLGPALQDSEPEIKAIFEREVRGLLGGKV